MRCSGWLWPELKLHRCVFLCLCNFRMLLLLSPPTHTCRDTNSIPAPHSFHLAGTSFHVGQRRRIPSHTMIAGACIRVGCKLPSTLMSELQLYGTHTLFSPRFILTIDDCALRRTLRNQQAATHSSLMSTVPSNSLCQASCNTRWICLLVAFKLFEGR